MNKFKIIIPALAIGVLGVGLSSTNFVSEISAHGNSDMNSSLIEKIASTFNLNKDDVQTIFDQNQIERQAQMEVDQINRQNTQLDDLLTAGKITTDQKNQIQSKLAEISTKQTVEKSVSNTNRPTREQMANMTTEQRDEQRALMEAEMNAQKNELQNWATSIGLNLEDFGNLFKIGGKGEMRNGGEMREQRNNK